MIASLYEMVARFFRSRKGERHASEEGIQPKNDQQQHQQVAVGGVSAGASGGHSPVNGWQGKARDKKGRFLPKSSAASAKEDGWRHGEKIQ